MGGGLGAAMPTHLCPQGKFQGLDLNEELYLGGYPDYAAVAKTGLSQGFVGERRVGGPEQWVWGG